MRFKDKDDKARRMRVEVPNHRNGLKIAMRKLQKMIEKDGLIKEMRKHEFYEKPSEKRRRRELRRKRTFQRLREEGTT